MQISIYVSRLRKTPIGPIQLAGTASGIVRIQLDDDGDALRAALLAAYPDARFKRQNEGTHEAARLLRRYLDGGPDPTFPVVMPEAGFHTRVWRHLRRIPRGQVRTYAGVARALRRHGAARAVGQACARNPLPLYAPCHRVVAADRRLGGFSGGGVEVKRALLQLEGAEVR